MKWRPSFTNQAAKAAGWTSTIPWCTLVSITTKMSGDFEQLNIPEPDANLSAGGTQAEQTGAIMVRFEEHLTKNPTIWSWWSECHVHHGVCHHRAEDACQGGMEAGIRSNDWTMPEEINRLVTDAITNCSSPSDGRTTLKASGFQTAKFSSWGIA